MAAFNAASEIGDQIFRNQSGLPSDDSTDAGGMNMLPEDQRTPPSEWGMGNIVAPERPTDISYDPETEARRAGYTWPEINDHIATSTAAALDAGYTPTDINRFLGYSDPAALADRTRGQWAAKLAEDPAAISSLSPDDLATLPEMRRNYADALMAREVKGPGDFAEHFTGALLGAAADRRMPADPQVIAEAGDAIAGSLPSNEEVTDTAIAIGQASGVPLDGAVVRNTKDNLLDYWTGLGGGSLMDAYRESNIDPLLQDALTTPKPPGPDLPPAMDDSPFGTGDWAAKANEHQDMAATLEDLQRPGRDRINPVSMLGEPIEHKTLLGDLEDLGLTVTATVAGGYVLKAGAAVVGSLVRSEGGQYVIKGLGHLLADESGTVNVPEGEGVAQLAEAMGRLGKARRQPTPDLPAPVEIGDLRPIVTKVEDDLNRLRTNATADKVVLTQALDRMPPAWLEPKLQEQISNEVEARMLPGGQAVAASSEVQEVLAGVKSMTDRQRELGDMIRAKLAGVAVDDPSISRVASVDEGYVHRIVKGKEPAGTIADPSVEQDVITGSGGQRSVSKFAPGMQQRSMYVLENEQGARQFGTKPLDELRNPALTPEEVGKPFTRQTATYGDTIETAGGGKWTIKPATMEEVEANTDIQYHKNFLANTVENVARLERVNRNLDFLQTTGKQLEEQGLFVRAAPGTTFPPPAADGMLAVNLPGMQGYAIPKIANALNDFFSADKGDLDNFLRKASRLLVGSLFVSPVVHAGNVGAHWAVGRGWDWIKPNGYGSLMRDGLDALREVWTQGPRYVEHLREGSSLLYASTTTENFYNTLMTKFFHEQMADQNTWGQYARGLGFPALVDLVKAEYRWSRKTLWAANDVFMLQRQFELERQGQTTRQAIFNAEKDIPNYRVPSEVMGSHTMSQFLQSPLYMNFGRYKYGQVRALGLVADDLARGSMQDRFDALGKLTVLGGIAFGAYPLMNAGLQKLTGDPGWNVRAFGPFSLIDAVRGFTSGQKDWLSAMSSFMSIGPLIDLVRRVSTNRDVWGRKIVDDKATWVGKIVQGLEAAGQTFYPSQLLLQGIKDGNPNKAIAGLLGGTWKPPVNAADQAKWDKRDLGEAVTRERKDVLEQWIKEHLGITDITTSPAPGRATGGSRGASSRTGGSAGPSITRSAQAASPQQYGLEPAAPQYAAPGQPATTEDQGVTTYRGSSRPARPPRIAAPRAPRGPRAPVIRRGRRVR